MRRRGKTLNESNPFGLVPLIPMALSLQTSRECATVKNSVMLLLFEAESVFTA